MRRVLGGRLCDESWVGIVLICAQGGKPIGDTQVGQSVAGVVGEDRLLHSNGAKSSGGDKNYLCALNAECKNQNDERNPKGECSNSDLRVVTSGFALLQYFLGYLLVAVRQGRALPGGATNGQYFTTEARRHGGTVARSAGRWHLCVCASLGLQRSQGGTRLTAKARRVRRGREEDSHAGVLFAFVVALYGYAVASWGLAWAACSGRSRGVREWRLLWGICSC